MKYLFQNKVKLLNLHFKIVPLELQKLKVNVFGELWTLKRVQLTPIENEYYGNIAQATKQPLHQALIDPFFYPKLRLENTQSFFDLRGDVLSGLTENSHNQIEIWYAGKREKIWVTNLKNSTIFPIYDIHFETKPKELSSGIYIETTEFGLIGSYEIMIPEFDTKNLGFSFLNYGNDLLLQNKFMYNGKGFKKGKTDASITRLNSFVVEPQN